MPAITVEDTLVLPRISRPDPATSKERPVARVVTARDRGRWVQHPPSVSRRGALIDLVLRYHKANHSRLFKAHCPGRARTGSERA